MISEPKISVIMPVYNAEKYVEAAINSVVTQDFDSFELICIDDGSTDGSKTLCKRAAGKDDRIRFFEQENSGVGVTRNRGMELAAGKYIAFIDCDDEYLPQLLSDNYSLAEKYDADVVKFGYVQQFLGKHKCRNKSISFPKTAVAGRSQIGDHYTDLNYNCGLSVVWNGLYSREFLRTNGICQHERLAAGLEDTAFNADVCLAAKTMVFNRGEYYVWYSREGQSTSEKYLSDREAESYSALEQQIETALKFGLDAGATEAFMSVKTYFAYISAAYSLCRSNCPLTKSESVKAMKKMRERELFSKYLTPDRVKCIAEKCGLQNGLSALLIAHKLFGIWYDAAKLKYLLK